MIIRYVYVLVLSDPSNRYRIPLKRFLQAFKFTRRSTWLLIIPLTGRLHKQSNAYFNLVKNPSFKASDTIKFVVPTGNFGPCWLLRQADGASRGKDCGGHK